LFAVRPGQGLYQWGCSWRSHGAYSSLEAVRGELHLEEGSEVGDVRFADWNALDLRVPGDSPVVALGCYPQGEVPGVRLGVGG